MYVYMYMYAPDLSDDVLRLQREHRQCASCFGARRPCPASLVKCDKL